MASYLIRAEHAGGVATAGLPLAVNQAGPALRLEPVDGATIGVGQTLDLFVAFWSISTQAFPEYVDPGQVSWSSAQPAVASVGADGIVNGLSEGSTIISASYQTLTKQISVTVGGQYVSRSVSVPGQGIREYALLVPSGVAPGLPLPVMLAIHGAGASARLHASMTLLSDLGQSQKVLIAYLEGSGRTFNAGNCCGAAQANNVDDVAYARAVLDDVIARHAADTTRVYASGFSNGAMMSYRLACAMADRLAGIVAVGGASGQFDQDLNQYYSCTPVRPIPVIQVHGTNDRVYPLGGGFGNQPSLPSFYSVDATVADWRGRNNVTAQATSEQISPTTSCSRYATRADTSTPSAPVTLCILDPVDVYDPATNIVFGGGHSWPKGNRPGDAPATDFNVNTYLWRSFGN